MLAREVLHPLSRTAGTANSQGGSVDEAGAMASPAMLLTGHRAELALSPDFQQFLESSLSHTMAIHTPTQGQVMP